MNYELLGKRIRAERKKQHLTQEQLAEHVNISPVFLSQIETNKRIPSLETIFNIANYLSVSIDSLCFEDDNVVHHLHSKIYALLNGRTEKEKQLAFEILQQLLSKIENDKIKQ